jgi:hypothetical protein
MNDLAFATMQHAIESHLQTIATLKNVILLKEAMNADLRAAITQRNQHIEILKGELEDLRRSVKM